MFIGVREGQLLTHPALARGGGQQGRHPSECQPCFQGGIELIENVVRQRLWASILLLKKLCTNGFETLLAFVRQFNQLIS